MTTASALPHFIEENVSLKTFNTFGIDVKARYLATVQSMDELKKAITFQKEHNLTLLPMGGGSNMLFFQDYEGLVLKIAIKGISVQEINGTDEVLITSMAGENWHEFVLYTLQHGYYGLENLSLIPGCVGAAPMQNIGAYGVETKDSFHELSALMLDTGEIITLNAEQCKFAYRESVFKAELKQKAIIYSVTFKLNKTAKVHTHYGAINEVLQEKGITLPSPIDVSKAVISIRKSKLPDPAVTGNAGSFFKNPEIPLIDLETLQIQYPTMPFYNTSIGFCKVPAGWLIEQAGWKGHNRITHGVHPKQALVLVNYGGATGAEIWQLAMDVQESVLTKFGIRLHPEVNKID